MPKTGDTMSASQKRKIAKAVSKYHKSACRGMSEYVRKKPNVAKGGGTIKRIKAGEVKRKALQTGKDKAIKRGLLKAVRQVKKKQQVKKTAKALKSVMTSTERAAIKKNEVSREKGGKKLVFKRMGGRGDLLTMEDKKKLSKDIDTKWKEMLKENPSYYSTTKTERIKIRKRFFGIASGGVELYQKYKKLRIQRQRERIAASK
jgi:hypothetical protein